MLKYIIPTSLSLFIISLNDNNIHQKQSDLPGIIYELNYNFDFRIDCQNNECGLPYEKNRKNLDIYTTQDAMPYYREELFKYQVRRFIPNDKYSNRFKLNFNQRIIYRTFRRARDPGF